MLSPAYSSLLRRSGAGALWTALTRPTTAPLPGPAAILSAVRRSLHQVPDLHNQEVYEQYGIDPLFSPGGFNIAWREYQGMLVDGLNELVAGTTLEEETALDIALQTSRRPELAATFNFASQAHNNHFFFESLVDHRAQPSPEPLTRAVADTFSNIDALKAELTATALSLFGSGTVWLVMDRSRRLRILATYNAGTPYPGAHGRRQDIDTNTLSGPLHGYQNDTLSSTMAAAKGAGGMNMYPLPVLSVSVWPQVYMTDYGVDMKRRRAYLENWWKCINWDLVVERYNRAAGSRASEISRRMIY